MCHKPLILKDDSSWEVWAQPNVLYIHPLTYVIFIYAQSLQLCPTLCNPMDYSLPEEMLDSEKPTGNSLHTVRSH